MILQRIVEFAEQNVKNVPTGYQPRFLTKIIELNADGSLRQVKELAKTQRNKRWGEERFEPQETPRRAGDAIKARLVSDNPNYVLGKAREQDKPKKVEARHAAWRDQLRKAADELQLPELLAIHHWVENGGAEQLRDHEGIDEADELSFEVEGVAPTQLPQVQAYWANQAESKFTGQCLITGLRGPVTDRMPAPIKGVPRGQVTGMAVVSVNNQAGNSYGHSAALNSPISPAAAEKLCNGLNHLINDGEMVKDKKDKDRKRYNYSLRVGPTLYLAWCREQQVGNVLENLNSPDTEHVQQLIGGLLAQKGPQDIKDSDFYVLSLSANAARIIIRDFHELTLVGALENIQKWYDRIYVLSVNGEPSPPPGIYRLATSLYRDANKEMPAHVPSDIIGSALLNRPLPDYLLGLAVKRNLAMQGPFTLNKAQQRVLATSRIALIKAVLSQSMEEKSLTKINYEQTNPAYHCGRLLAVLESIQRTAIPNLNTTLTDRHYGAACASPASVFGNLLKDAVVSHLSKISKDRKGAYLALDQRLQEITVAIGDTFPSTLTLKDQGLFSLGYYHQRAHDSTEARKNKELKDQAALAATEEVE